MLDLLDEIVIFCATGLSLWVFTAFYFSYKSLKNEQNLLNHYGKEEKEFSRSNKHWKDIH